MIKLHDHSARLHHKSCASPSTRVRATCVRATRVRVVLVRRFSSRLVLCTSLTTYSEPTSSAEKGEAPECENSAVSTTLVEAGVP